MPGLRRQQEVVRAHAVTPEKRLKNQKKEIEMILKQETGSFRILRKLLAEL
jgi:hypothetical protein